MGALLFTLNQKRIEIPDGSSDLDLSLLEFLRKQRSTGCKQVCGEGGCGACSVILSHWDEDSDHIFHRSVTGCLIPLPYVHRMQITTIEGLSSLAGGKLHPIAEAFYEMGASQCGFCTPGFLMSFMARISGGEIPEKTELEHIFDGNLCRCTGYRPILDAASVFCKEPFESPEFCRKIERWRKRYEKCQSLDEIFPNDFKTKVEGCSFKGKETSWILPVRIADAVAALEKEPNSKLVAGNSDLGYEERYRPKHNQKCIALHRVSELHQIDFEKEGVRMGAAATIEALEKELSRKLSELPSGKCSGLYALLNQCRFLGNRQVRSVATVGGGIMNFSHYSDLIPIWVACDAKLHFATKEIELRDCYSSEGALEFNPKEMGLLTSIFVPYTSSLDRVASFKYARRRMDSITLMSAGMKCRVDGEGEIQEMILCFDGLGRPGQRALKTESFLVGKIWNQENLKDSINRLGAEVDECITNPLPKPLQEYQMRLSQGALLRFYKRYRKSFFSEDSGDDESLLSRYPEVAHRSEIYFEEASDGVLGKAIPHRNAKAQTSGEATYTNDVDVVGEVFGSLVTSPVASGRILSIDPSQALSHPDVLGFYSAKDIPGKNLFGFRVEDEEVLASERVHFVGQAVGILLAKSQKVAREQAWEVKVDIEKSTPILEFKDAIEKGSTHGKPEGYLLKQGDLDQGFRESEKIIEGEVSLPGQYAFYLEPQNAVCIPKESGFEIYSSTQSPSNVVGHVSSLMNVPKSKVHVQVGRLGGGFGGKQLRAGPIAAICALAAHHSRKPVKLSLDRAQDMAYCPGRSAAWAKYRAGFDSKGKIKAVDIEFYLNGGFSNDYSADIAETATLLMDSSYRLENVRVKGTCLKMNTGSNTSTRGFGKPQSSAIIESILDHGASALSIDRDEVRANNLYKKGDFTITRTELKDDVMEKCWSRLLKKSDYTNLKKEVSDFNRSNRWLKRGIAATVSKGNMGFIESDDINRGLALVHILEDGAVSVNHSGTEMGQGINTRMAQVAAAALEVPLNRVEVTDTQSALIPNTPPTTMVATDLVGQAIIQACEKLKESLSGYEGGFQERVENAYRKGENLSATGVYTAPRLSYDYEKQRGDISYFFVWGAALSLVEVDLISGSFRILKSRIVQDCGKSLNPHLDIGQAEGGFLYGIGYYLMEEMIYSPEGRLISDNVSGYKIPSCGDVPLDWDIELLNYRPDTASLHNSKGIGEANTQLGLSAYFALKEAVRSARKDAGMDGVFNLGFPASVDRVSRALPRITDLIT